MCFISMIRKYCFKLEAKLFWDASINIQGLLTSGRQKKEAVLQLMRNENIEVLAMQEHWLTKNHKFPEPHLEGFREL